MHNSSQGTYEFKKIINIYFCSELFLQFILNIFVVDFLLQTSIFKMAFTPIQPVSSPRKVEHRFQYWNQRVTVSDPQAVTRPFHNN